MYTNRAMGSMWIGLCCLIGYVGLLRAQDVASGKCGVPVHVGPGTQTLGLVNWFNTPILGYSDGSCLLFWNDQQADSDTSFMVKDVVRMQSVRADGMFQFPIGGVELTSGTRLRTRVNLSFLPVATTREFIGVYKRVGDSVWKVEKFDKSGARIWELDRPWIGYTQSTAWIAVCSDGLDGVFAANMRPGLRVDRIDAAGTRGWGINGIEVPTSTTAEISYILAVESDGRGGAYVMYFDQQSPLSAGWKEPDTWIQRVSSDGVHWRPTGRLVCQGVRTFGESMLRDNDGNIVVLATEESHRNRLRVQKFSPAGTRLWDSAGVMLYESPHQNHWASMIPDGSNGHFIAWNEYTGTNPDPIQESHLRMQRIDAAGRKLWGSDGIRIATGWMGLWNGRPQLVTDQHGGVMAFWYTGYAKKDTVVHESDIYMQRLDGNGHTLWGAEARPLCNAEGDQEPVFVVSDEHGGAHVLWGDGHKGKNEWDVYYAHVTFDGVVSAVEETSQRFVDSEVGIAPSVVRDAARVTISSKAGEPVRVSVYDMLGRELSVLYEGEMAQTQRSLAVSASEYAGGSYILLLQTKTLLKCVPFFVLR